MKTSAIDPKLIAARVVEGAPRHDVIYAAATGLDGKIYLGLSTETYNPGVFARLLAYDPAADALEEIADLQKLLPEAGELQRHPHSKIHTSMCAGHDGKIYAVTHMTAPPAGEDYYHYWHVYNDPVRCFKGAHLIIHDPKTKTTTDFGIVSPKGGCRWLAYNPEREELYLTTFLTAHFMVIRLKTGEVKDLGRISQYDFMGPCYSAAGFVYTTDCRGGILRYSPQDESIERLPVQIPDAPRRDSDQNGVFNFLPGADGVKLYGAAMRARRLFEYDPTIGKYGRIRDLGPAIAGDFVDDVTEFPFIRAMAIGRDGRIYAGAHYARDEQGNINSIAGLMNMRANIIAVDPATGDKQDFGVMQAPGMPPILCPVAATAAADGAIYFTTWKVKSDLPLQVIAFNPAGVKQAPLALKPNSSAGAAGAAVADANPVGQLYHLPCRADACVFVARGRVVARELGDFRNRPSLPRNECAITALAVARDGGLFGATSGNRSHLFYMTPLAGRTIPLNVLGAGPAVCRHLAMDAQGRLFAGITDGVEGRLCMYDVPAQAAWMRGYDDVDRGEFSGRLLTPTGACVRLDDCGVPVPGEGLHSMALDPVRGLIYGLSWPGGKFFIYDIASRQTEVKDIFAKHMVKRQNISRAILCYNGYVYFSGRHGYLIRYSPQDGDFVDSGLKIPCGAGREYLNAATAFTVTPAGRIFGGAAADGCLFRFDPEQSELINLGRPSMESCIAGLAAGRDGMVWGLSGGPEQLTHLFCHNPRTGEMRDCGIMRAKIPKTWVVHRAEAIVTGPDGELYIGENDAMSHLLIYCPNII